MRLIDLDNYELKVADEALLIRPIRELYEADKSKRKEGFYRQLADEPNIDKTMQIFLDRGRNETVPDQWQTQIFLRILKRATVIYVSDADDGLVEDLHMIPAHSINEALSKAKEILNNDKPSVVAIPDGVAVMVVDN